MGAGMTAQAPGRFDPPLLARNAENLLWLARYIERVENVARILDVTQVFTRDERDGSHWRMVLRINADEPRFLAANADVNARSVARFYLLDRGNPTSVPVSIMWARENARTLRSLIPTEMWLRMHCSPVPAHTTVGSDGATARAPIDCEP